MMALQLSSQPVALWEFSIGWFAEGLVAACFPLNSVSTFWGKD
jgi:hypothetical protein